VLVEAQSSLIATRRFVEFCTHRSPIRGVCLVQNHRNHFTVTMKRVPIDIAQIESKDQLCSDGDNRGEGAITAAEHAAAVDLHFKRRSGSARIGVHVEDTR